MWRTTRQCFRIRSSSKANESPVSTKTVIEAVKEPRLHSQLLLLRFYIDFYRLQDDAPSEEQIQEAVELLRSKDMLTDIVVYFSGLLPEQTDNLGRVGPFRNPPTPL